MNFKILALVILLFSAACAFSQTAPAASTTVSTDCALKPDQLDALLALPFLKFDQDQSGWRELQDKGCELTAAMLIDTYLVDAPEELKTIHREDLYWHAGQLYAMAGMKKLAIRHFYRSLNLHEGSDDDFSWNPYVLATIAFLQGDRDELAHQRQLLADAKPTRENKINLGAVDGFAKCFDKTYKDAYSASCRVSEK